MRLTVHIVPEKTLVVAEFFLGTKSGQHVLPSAGTEDMAAFAASLEHLRNLPIERVLVAHGLPVLAGGKSAIRAALKAFAKERQ